MDKKKEIILLSALLFAFGTITFLVITKNPIILSLDQFVRTFAETYQFPSVSKMMLSVTKILNPIEGFIIFAVFGLFLKLKDKVSFYLFTLATIFGVVLSSILKSFTQIDRPSMLIEQDYSFPSIHATIAVVFLLSAIYLIVPLIKNVASKNIFIFTTVFVFPLVAISRVYLSAHWSSDILAGIILGFICFLFAHLLCCHQRKNVL